MPSTILSVKKLEKYGIQNEKWTNKDKIYQYRGILKLHGRNKKLKVKDAVRLQRKISKVLKTLKSEVKEYRQVFKDIQFGDKSKIHRILQNHQDLQRAYDDQNLLVVYEAINQDIFFKRKQFDKTHYIKKKKENEFLDLKLEWVDLMNKYEQQTQLKEPDKEKEHLAVLNGKMEMNIRAAENIQSTYLSKIKTLEKDKIYFEAIINILKSDRHEQCAVLMQATYLGQKAVESLDDTREKYKKMEVDVLKNMKERERTLKTVRSRAENLWNNVKRLSRVDSYSKYIEIMSGNTTSVIEEYLREDIKSLEETFDRVKDAVLVQSYDELFTRFKEQARLKTHLTEQRQKSLEQRNLFRKKKKNAMVILDSVKQSMNTSIGEYKDEKSLLLEKIEIEKKREINFLNLKKSQGELLIKIKLGLQNMLASMVCVSPGVNLYKKPTKDTKKNKEKRKRTLSGDTKIKAQSLNMSPESKSTTDDTIKFEKMDTDVLNILSQVEKRATFIYGLCNFELEPDEKEKAKNLYQDYVAKSIANHRFQSRYSESTQLIVDHEIMDSNVITRKDIKNQSKLVTEANIKWD